MVEFGVFGWLEGDFIELMDALGAGLVEIELGLVVAFDEAVLDAGFFKSF